MARPWAGRGVRYLALGAMVSVLIGTTLGSLLGCGMDATVPGPHPTEQVYWALQLNQHALVMAPVTPYDTVQLRATPVNPSGTPLAGLGPVTFSSKDSSVTVSPTGLVTARYPTSTLVPVVAALQDPTQGVTHYDTAFVLVTSTAPSTGLATFSMQPVSGDSAKRPLPDGNVIFGPDPWPVTAVDFSNTILCGLYGCSIPVYYQSSNSEVATIDKHTGLITKNDTGHTVLTAQTLYYGRPYRDSITFRVGLMIYAIVFLRPAEQSGGPNIGPKITLGVGGMIIFINQFAYFGQTDPYQITFGSPAFADSLPTALAQSLFGLQSTGSGNITFTPSDGLSARLFPAAGTTQMHVSLFPNLTSEIHVIHE